MQNPPKQALAPVRTQIMRIKVNPLNHAFMPNNPNQNYKAETIPEGSELHLIKELNPTRSYIRHLHLIDISPSISFSPSNHTDARDH